MTKLVPIKLAGGVVIYIESSDASASQTTIPGDERHPVSKGGNMERALGALTSIQDTIRTYTTYTLNSFKEISVANVNKVTLEFGLKVGGEAGIPYITKGTAESNLKITVECSFPDRPRG